MRPRHGLARAVVQGTLLVGVMAVAIPTRAAEEEATAASLAILASDVHATHCAGIASDRAADAATRLQAVSQVWGDIDVELQSAEFPEPFLLYWRGVLAQCLGQADRAVTDFEGLLQGASFLQKADSPSAGPLGAMVRDAKRRLRILRSGRTMPSAAVPRAVSDAARTSAPGRGGGVQVSSSSSRRGAGVALTVGGATTAAAGFAVSIGLYQNYYVPETDRTTYDAARRGATAGFTTGILGAVAGVTGLVLLISTTAAKPGTVAVLPGPITYLVGEF